MNILLLILLAVIVTFAYAGLRGAPWVPTRGHDVGRFLKLADIKPGQKVYDLGCGDGRMVCAAANAGAQAQGFEISLFPYVLAKLRASVARHCVAQCLATGIISGSCKISFRDFWNVDLSDADILYFFLMQKCYPKLKEKLERELKPGTKGLSYVWPNQHL